MRILSPRCVISVLFILLTTLYAFPEKIGLKTLSADGKEYLEEHQFEPSDKNYVSSERAVFAYSLDGKVTRIKYFMNSTEQEKTGFYSQEEVYTPEGRTESFIIQFTPKRIEESGVDTVIEKTDENDVTTSVEYQFQGKYLFRERDIKTLTRFPFYKLSFIQKVMFEENENSPGHANYGVSVKYVSGRSFVKFLNTPIDIDQKDRDAIRFYLKTRGAPDKMADLYNKKVLAEENGKEYYIMIQDGNLQYIKKGNKAAIYYYIFTIDDRLELLSVGFTDIK